MFLVRLLRSSIVGGVANWSSLLGPLLSLSFVGAAMSWAASAYDTIYQHGWGAVVFAGVGAACAILATISLGAIAWRVAFPLNRTQATGQAEQIDADNAFKIDHKLENLSKAVILSSSNYATSEVKTNTKIRDLAEKIEKIDQRISIIEKMLEPDKPALGLLSNLGEADKPLPANRFESISAMVKRLEGYTEGSRAALLHMIGEINTRFERDERYFLQKHYELSRALSAGRAEAAIKLIDDIIAKHASNLLKADTYKTGSEWATDYETWEGAVADLDDILREWSDKHAGYLNVTSRDIERSRDIAPENIVGELEVNRIRYKKLHIVQRAYENERHDMLTYFSSEAQAPKLSQAEALLLQPPQDTEEKTQP